MNDESITRSIAAGEPLDPSPRSYPPMVNLLRRGTFSRTGLAPQSLREIESWLLSEAIAEGDLLVLFQSFVWRLVAAGLPLARASLHVGTLHPQLFGYAGTGTSTTAFATR